MVFSSHIQFLLYYSVAQHQFTNVAQPLKDKAMKKTLLYLIVLNYFMVLSAYATEISFFGKTDKNPLDYQPGEKMTFSVQYLEDGVPVSGKNLSWKRTGDDGKTETGKAISDANTPLIIETSIDIPGFVRIQVFPMNENDQMIGSEHSENIQFNGGAGVQLDQIKGIPEPDDFDAFWDKQKAILAQVPIKASLLPVESSDDNVLVFDVKVDCSGLAPVSGYLCMPKNAKEHSLPAKVQYQGYSVSSVYPDIAAGRNQIVFTINCHGFLNGQKNEYYQNLQQTFLASYGFSQHQNQKPDSCYWCGMIMRALRAVQYVKTLPEWDGKNLTTSGGSQGGMQCLTVAGLDSDVTYVDTTVPWFCDVSGAEKSGRIDSWFMPSWVDGLGYFDATNHAKRIKGSVLITAGLGDYVCPPSGEMVLYNSIQTTKKIIFTQGRTHGFQMKNGDKFILEESKDN